jgi:hypothetical protein
VRRGGRREGGARVRGERGEGGGCEEKMRTLPHDHSMSPLLNASLRSALSDMQPPRNTQTHKT